MRISSITPMGQDAKRVIIKVDGKCVAVIGSQHVAPLGLAVGQRWDTELGSRVEQAVTYDQAMSAAMVHLNRRMMTSQQLKRKLQQKRHSLAMIDQVSERLTELGLLDDLAFGKAMIRDLTTRKPAGPKLLRQKLWQCGIEPGLVDQLIDQHQAQIDPDQEVSEAAKLAQRKLPTMARLDAATRKRRLWGLLARRGFGSETINMAIEKALSESTS